MTSKKVSPAAAGRIKRNRKICDMYQECREKYDNATLLYNDIALKARCSYATVIRVLQSSNLI